MYTHDFADALKQLAAILRRGPNVELVELSSVFQPSRHGFSGQTNRRDDLPIALSALLSLSRIDKKEWIDLVQELGLKVEIRPRDASRDILGKVLKTLEDEPAARERLERRVKSKEKLASPELARALSSLLGK